MGSVADRDRIDTGSDAPDTSFQIFRRGRLYLIMGFVALAAAAVVSLAAWSSGVVWLWVPAAGLAVLGLVSFPGFLDAQTPMFVADEYGVRLHQRGIWVGLLWREIGEIVVEPGGIAGDARVAVTTKDARHRYTVPVGFTTSVSVADAEVELARRWATAAY